MALGFAIVAVMKGEARFLLEWVEYHLLVGVQHFFLSSNECGADAVTVRRLLQPYLQRGQVTLDTRFECVQHAVQSAAYARYHQLNGSSATWTAHIDLDEYIVVADPAQQVLQVFLALGARGAGVVAMPWRTFGSSGHRLRPNGSILASYTRRAKMGTSFHASSYKSVVRRGKCLKPSVHSCGGFAPGVSPQLFTPESRSLSPASHTIPAAMRCIQPRGARICSTNCALRPPPRSDTGAATRPPCVLWLNHYRTKSDEDWEAKKRRGQAASCPSCTGKHLSGEPPRYNDMRDDFIVGSVLVRLAHLPPAERDRVAHNLGVAHLKLARAAPSPSPHPRRQPHTRTGTRAHRIPHATLDL